MYNNTCTCIYMTTQFINVQVYMYMCACITSACFGSMYLHWFLIHVYCFKLLSSVLCKLVTKLTYTTILHANKTHCVVAEP